ncbi:MAG: autotransporter secretion inner membrane protein TamB [Candidatus Electronema aureum]|uniref:Autotransporter secretion inner membrane protein TamB n=1 Tax=Candidatus Electronema aureum TaxID=2005002 RepID=A0A521G5C8_9BACT|nr:MAG: autotransporter secretion inner membrane protein TamB [Candidatus Electronema aureum]
MTETAEKPEAGKERRRCGRLLMWSALLALLPLAGLVFLLSTETGLQLLLRSVTNVTGPLFSAEQTEGRLIDSWRIGKLQIQVKDEANISLDEFTFRWEPKALFINRELRLRRITARGLTVRITESAKKAEKKARKQLILPKIRLPFGVRIDELLLQDSRIFLPGKAEPLLINEVLLQASARDDQTEIARIKLDSLQYSADLRGSVQCSGSWPLHLSGSWRVADHGINELRGTAEAQGDMDKVAVSATMSSPAKVTLQGQVTDLLNNLHWQAAAKTGHFQLSDIKVNVPVDGNLRIVEANGTVKSYSGVLAADIHYAGYPTVQAEAKVTANDYAGLKVDYLTVKQDAAELTLRGDMHWKGGFSWQAELESKELNPALAAAAWPGKISGLLRSSGRLAAGTQELAVSLEGIGGELRGQPFQLDGTLALADKSLTIDALTLQAGSGTVRLKGKAAVDKTLDLTVQADVADLSEFLPNYSGAAQLQGSVVGTIEQSAVQLNVNGTGLRIQERSLPDLQADVTADLSLSKDNSGLNVHDLRLVADGKSALQLTGQLGWVGGLSWQAAVKAAELDPSLIAPDWPGAINAELRSQGSKTTDQLTAEVQIDTLSGMLRGFPLTGSGKAKLDGKALTVDALRLQSGSSYVQINGQVNVENGGIRPAIPLLTFKAGSDDLAHLVPAAQGKFRLEGAVSGKPQQPSITLTASGSQLRMQEYGLKELTAAIKADLSPTGHVDAEIKAAGIQVKQETIRTANIRAKGSAEQHRLDFAAEGSPGKLQLAVAGGWKEQQWQGQLAELELINKQFGTWKTDKAAALTLAAEHCALSGFALVQNRVRAAISGQWQKASGWQVQTQLDHLSLDLLHTWQVPVPENFPVMHGEVALTAAAQGQGAVPQHAELTLSLPTLALTAENYDEEGETTWTWQDNRIAARLHDDTFHLTAQTTFQDGSTAALAATASNCGNFKQTEQMPLSGQLNVNIRDISPLTKLTGYAIQTTGGFGGTVDLRGTAARPTLNGLLTLKNGKSGEGKIHIPAAGINLRELRLAVEGDGNANKVDLQVASGTGTLRAQGMVSRTPNEPLQAEFTLQGQAFQAVDLPEYQVWVSPDLRLGYGKRGTTLTGTLAVPKARIAPTGFSGAATSSKDVIVIDSEGKPPENTLPLSVEVALALGNEVAVDAFGLKGFLDGDLKINAKPDRAVTALGTLSLRDASVDFEGVSLQLNEGRIFYQGGPIDNPGLDIRASRKVNKVEAGIHLTGNASNMDMKLFSDTAMDDSEILSWLLTGQNGMSSSRGDATLSPAAAALSKVGGGALLKSVNPLAVIDMEDFVDVSIGGGKEASDVSLVMGKEIYKDLYLSYGKDLTGEGGSFKARYDLKYGFSVETENTSKTTGADLIWSLEK